jgi:Crinkler effector protein N-terminal domain
MAATLRLNCWVDGDDISQVFPVTIPNIESVGTLKEAIKEKNLEAFRNIDARSPLL